jgi:hypothetical protein
MMFESLERSWNLTKLSIDVMKADKELFLFPVLAGIFSLLFIIAMLFPTVIWAVFTNNTPADGPILYGLLFLTYFGLSIIATFFNVCVVFTVKKRLAGEDAAFGESLKFAFSRLGTIIAWGAISATVGVILRFIENLGDQLGPLGDFIVHMITGALGAAWSLLTIFVVPGMVYKNLGPFDAIKESAEKFKKTWGENLVGMVGFGIVEFLFLFVGTIAFVLLMIFTASLGMAWIASVIAVGVIYILAVIIFFSLAYAIFQTTLYEYAQTGKVPAIYPEEYVKGAFRKKT